MDNELVEVWQPCFVSYYQVGYFEMEMLENVLPYFVVDVGMQFFGLEH